MRTRGKTKSGQAAGIAGLTLATLLAASAAHAQTAAPNAPNSPNTANGQTNPAQTTPQAAPGQTTNTTSTGQPLTGQTGARRNVNSSPDFDLARTIRESYEASSQLEEARRNIQIDEQRVSEINAQRNLNVSGNASATRYDATTRISIGGGPAVTVLPNHTEQLSLILSQRLDLLGQVRAESNQARLQVLADQNTIYQIENQRRLYATQIYYNLLRAQSQVQVGESNLRSAQTQRDTARRLYEGGVGQKIDYLRAETNVAQAEQDLIRARNNADLARSNFNDLVGRPLDAPVNLPATPGVTVGTDVTPPAPPAGQPVGTPPAAPAFTPFTVPPAEVSNINVDQDIQTAIARRPEVVNAEVQVRVQDAGIRLARVGQEPTFALSASGNYYPTTSFQFPRDRTAAITATVTFPFYDGGATRARVNAARLRTENARTVLGSVQSAVTLDVRQAYLNLSTAARQIDAANAALQQAIAARQLAQVRYEGQVGLFLEVTDAQAALVRAENAQVDAVYNYLTARAQYEYATGLRTPVTTTTPATPGTTPPAPNTPAPAATPAPTTPAPATNPTP